MDDLISRKQAVDALKGLPTWWANEVGYYGGAHPPMEALLDPEDAVSAIENLPSAQPEIVRCKDCRHGVDYYHDGDCYCLNPKWGLTYFGGSWEFYCADAERRTHDKSGMD